MGDACVAPTSPTAIDDRSLDHGMRRRLDAAHHHLRSVHHLRDARPDRLLPVVALVDLLIEAVPLRVALEAAHPDVEVVLLLADEAADDHHPLRHVITETTCSGCSAG